MSIEDILMNDRDAANEMAEIMLSVARELKKKNQVVEKKVIRNNFDIINNVKEFIRPAIIIQDDKFQLPKSQSVSGRMRSDAAQKSILSAIRASGKIEAEETGTAWVVAKNIMVTNRHVVMNNDHNIYDSFKNEKALVNFKSEYNISSETFRFAIKKVLHVDKEHDIAFLAVDFKDSSPPEPIRVTGGAKKDQDVCVIGYPTKPRDTSEIEEEIFRFNESKKNGVKRISPGKIFTLDNKLYHDCSTSGGSSGSVIFDYTNSTAVGIHCSGAKNRNIFVPSFIIADRLKNVLS